MKAPTSTEVTDRKKYAQEQEQIINEMIEKGNNRISDLDFEYRQLLRKYEQLETDIEDLEINKKSIEEDIIVIDNNKKALEAIYLDTASKYKADLQAQESKMNLLTEQYEAKQSVLDARKAHLDAQEEQIERKKAVLEARETKLR